MIHQEVTMVLRKLAGKAWALGKERDKALRWTITRFMLRSHKPFPSISWSLTKHYLALVFKDWANNDSGSRGEVVSWYTSENAWIKISARNCSLLAIWYWWGNEGLLSSQKNNLWRSTLAKAAVRWWEIYACLLCLGPCWRTCCL